MPRTETIPRDKLTPEQDQVLREIRAVARSIATHEGQIAARQARRAELYAKGTSLGLNARMLGEAAGVTDVAVTKALRKAGLA